MAYYVLSYLCIQYGNNKTQKYYKWVRKSWFSKQDLHRVHLPALLMEIQAEENSPRQQRQEYLLPIQGR